MRGDAADSGGKAAENGVDAREIRTVRCRILVPLADQGRRSIYLAADSQSGGVVEQEGEGIASVTTSRDEFLLPLLADGLAVAAEYRRRRNPSDVLTIHPADAEEFLQKGWKQLREGKRKSHLSRPKAHDRWLEDRLWCLAHAMGFSRLNGQRFKIEFERKNGTSDRKQIDVFAGDDEAVLVIECKSRETRGRRTLQKDLSETAALQEYIRNTVYASYSNRPRPKLIWVYATQNIIWSEPDTDRANDAGISIVTENELQYFEAFLRHMGPAGRYQILAEFLKGQKIPGLEGMKVPAIRGRLGGETFYSFVVSPRYLLKIAFINHQALNHPDGKPAYQRMISSSRIREIGHFIEGGGYFPTNILINFAVHPKFEPTSNKDADNGDVKLRKHGDLQLLYMYSCVIARATQGTSGHASCSSSSRCA